MKNFKKVFKYFEIRIQAVMFLLRCISTMCKFYLSSNKARAQMLTVNITAKVRLVNKLLRGRKFFMSE